MLSAVAGKAARRVFERSELIVVTTEENIAEVIEYVPEFAARYGIDEAVLFDVVAMLPVTIYARADYSDALSRAHRAVGRRDEDDVALAALALKLQIPIWSNDRDYENFPTGVFTTAMLIKVLSV